MKLSRLLISFGLVAFLCACGKPVPPEKASYVGEWQEKTMYRLITQDGSVDYKRVKGGATVTVTGPLKEFKGDNFDIGIGPMTTTFEVNKVPYQEGERWKMVVDGVVLTRTAQ